MSPSVMYPKGWADLNRKGCQRLLFHCFWEFTGAHVHCGSGKCRIRLRFHICGMMPCMRCMSTNGECPCLVPSQDGTSKFSVNAIAFAMISPWIDPLFRISFRIRRHGNTTVNSQEFPIVITYAFTYRTPHTWRLSFTVCFWMYGGSRFTSLYKHIKSFTRF